MEKEEQQEEGRGMPGMRCEKTLSIPRTLRSSIRHMAGKFSAREREYGS